MISFISKTKDSFLNDLNSITTSTSELIYLNRYQFLPKWLNLFLSQKEICLEKNYLSNNKEVSKIYFSTQPLECLNSNDIYYIDTIISNKTFSFFNFYKRLRQKYIISSLANAKIYTASNTLKNHILNEFKPLIKNLKIQVQYPSIIQKKTDYKKIKTKFCKYYELDFNDKILIYKGDDFINDGGKEFINIYEELCNEINKKIVAIFITHKSQLEGFRFMARKLNSYKNIIFYDINNLNFQIEELFTISDIYLHPTYRKKFNRDLIKAMYYKNAVFISYQNYASELVDTFSLIENPTDLGIVHKIKALFYDEQSLKDIQEENKQKVINLNINNIDFKELK